MRLLVLAWLLTVPIAGSALADDSAARRKLIEGMRRGYAQSAGGSETPNLIDILQNRFPGDLERLADTFLPDQRAGKPFNGAKAGREIARLVVEIQSREIERIKTAPAASLRAVIEAQRGLLQAASEAQPPLCVVFVSETQARQSPTKEIGRWSVIRLAAIFNAIADGRDKPVPSREAVDADWDALATDAAKRGFDVKSWALLTPRLAQKSPPAAVCDALLSSLDAIATTPGELGEKLLVTQVSGMLTIDPAVYRRLR
jgi:hypothetical protein